MHERALVEFISSTIKKNHLTELGSFYHFFNDITSFTAVISLAESHVSIHTWPETGYVSIDIFVCGYLADHSQNAFHIFQKFRALFCPEEEEVKYINRSVNPMMKKRQGMSITNNRLV